MQRAAPISGDRYTLVTYLRTTAVPGDSRPVFVAVDSGLTQYEGIEHRSNGVIRFHYVDGAGYSQYNTFVSLSLDTWWAFGLARDGDDLYMYAREEGGSTQAWSVNTSQASRNAWSEIRWRFPITSHNEATGYQLTRLFDEPLSQAAIEAEWDSETPVNTTDLIADWEFANDTTDATRRNDAFATYDLSGTSDTDWGATDLPAVFGGGGPTVYEVEGASIDFSDGGSTAALAAVPSAHARDGDDAATVASTALSGSLADMHSAALASAGSLGLQAVGSTAQHSIASSPASLLSAREASDASRAPAASVGSLASSAFASSTDRLTTHALGSLLAAATASDVERETVVATGEFAALAMADSSDRSLANLSAQLQALIEAEAHSYDEGIGAAVAALVVPAIATSVDGDLPSAVAAIVSSVLAASIDRELANVAGELVVRGMASSVSDALAFARWIDSTSALVSYQTVSRAADTRSRSRAASTISRCHA